MSKSTHIICSSCGAKNRVPTERMSKGPRCGTCKTDLFADKPFDLDEAALNKHLSHDEVPLLVDFWAPWCGPCLTMAPRFAEAAKQLSPVVRLAKLNTEDIPAAGQRFAIRGIPLMILFHKGHEIARSAGALDTRAIVGWVNSNLTASSSSSA